MVNAKINERGILLAEQYGCWVAKRCWKNRSLFCTDDCAMMKVEEFADGTYAKLCCGITDIEYKIKELHAKDTGIVRDE